MKIVHILHSLRGGGIQNFLLSLASEQALQGKEVTVIVIDKYDSIYCQHLEDIFISKGVRIVKLEKIIGNKASLLKAIFKTRKLLEKIKPDILNSHAEISHFYGSIATLGTKIPHVVTIHNAPEYWNNVLKFVCKNKPLIFCSQAAYDLRKQDSNSKVVIDNGVSRDIIHSTKTIDLRKEFNLSNSDKVVILVGSLRPQKNYVFLKDIVEELKDDSFHFFICGGGELDEKSQGRKKISDYNNIHFLGLRSDVSAIENGADIFLSCATFEGLPIAVLEAYFNGIPCVLSPIDQHKRIANVAKVWIPTDFTAKSFVESLKQAYFDIDNHDVIYEMRKPQISQYSISKVAEKYSEFYNLFV